MSKKEWKKKGSTPVAPSSLCVIGKYFLSIESWHFFSTWRICAAERSVFTELAGGICKPLVKRD